MFAVASMFGFESTAIYSAEAKDAHRTVARATYLSVGVIAVFFSFISWMLVSYYGPSQVVDGCRCGPGVRRLHCLRADSDGGAVRAVGRNHHRHPAGHVPAGRNHRLPQRHQPLPPFTGAPRAPCPALWPGPTGTARRPSPPGSRPPSPFVLVAPFAVLSLDPVLTLFSWFSGLAVAALLVLYMLCSIAVVGLLPARTGGRPALADPHGAVLAIPAAGLGPVPGGQQLHVADRWQCRDGRCAC